MLLFLGEFMGGFYSLLKQGSKQREMQINKTKQKNPANETSNVRKGQSTHTHRNNNARENKTKIKRGQEIKCSYRVYFNGQL